MKISKIVTSIVVVFCCTYNVNAQSVLRTEMRGKTVELLNPALIGVNDNGQVNLMEGIINYSPFKSNFSYAGYNTHINKISGGIGAYYFSKKDYNNLTYTPLPNKGTTNIGLSYAFQHNQNEKLTLSLGATAGYYKYTEYWEDFAKNINCTNCPSSNIIETAVDVNIGGLLYSKHLYFGASVFNVANRNKKPIDIAPFNAKVNLGYTFISKTDENIKLTLGAMAEYDGVFTNYKLNTLFKYKKVYTGISFSPFILIIPFMPFLNYYGIIDNSSAQLGVEYDRFRLNYNVTYNNFYIYDEQNKFSQEIALQIKIPKTLTRQSNKFEHILF